MRLASIVYIIHSIMYVGAVVLSSGFWNSDNAVGFDF